MKLILLLTLLINMQLIVAMPFLRQCQEMQAEILKVHLATHFTIQNQHEVDF